MSRDASNIPSPQNAERKGSLAERVNCSQSIFTGNALGLALLILELYLFYIYQLAPQWTVFTQYNYGWAVPFLSIFLFWNRWKTKPHPTNPLKTRSFFILTGVLLACLPLLRILLEANPGWRIISAVFFFLVLGVLVIALNAMGGISWIKHFLFPVVFLAASIPWPGHLETLLVDKLTNAASFTTGEVLTVLGLPVLRNGSVFETSFGTVGIEEACSGIRSLQACLMLALFFGEFYLLSWRKRIILIVAAPLLAFVFNVIRTMLLVWIGSQQGLTALEKWHDSTGTGVLLSCFVALWMLSLHFEKKGIAFNPLTNKTGSESRPLRWAFVMALGLWLITTEVGTQLWYRSRDARWGARPVGWTIHPPTNALNYVEFPLSPVMKDKLKYDNSYAAGWYGSAEEKWQLLCFKWGAAATRFRRMILWEARNHAPEICFPHMGKEFISQRDAVFNSHDIILPFRCGVFNENGKKLHVYFSNSDGLAADKNKSFSVRWERIRNALQGNRRFNHELQTVVFAVWGIDDESAADRAFQQQLEKVIIVNDNSWAGKKSASNPALH